MHSVPWRIANSAAYVSRVVTLPVSLLLKPMSLWMMALSVNGDAQASVALREAARSCALRSQQSLLNLFIGKIANRAGSGPLDVDTEYQSVACNCQRTRKHVENVAVSMGTW